MRYDYIVVGGGTTGSIIASRLSEERDLRVLLLEAGPDVPDVSQAPPEILSPNAPVLDRHNWGLEAHIRESTGNNARDRVRKLLAAADRHLPSLSHTSGALGAGFTPSQKCQYPIAKTLGGGSAINGGLWFPIARQDMDNWGDRNDWWRWERVLPWLDTLGLGTTNSRAALGYCAPMDVASECEYTQVQRRFIDACRSTGWRATKPGEAGTSGFVTLPRNVAAGRKVSTLISHLAEARRRSNLHIRCDSLVDKLVFDSSCAVATGVQVLQGGTMARYDVRNVVLCAGAIQTPAILMRSGIGDRAELDRAGITALRHVPGVGRGLMEHPTVCLWAVPKSGTCAENEPVHQVMLRTSAGEGNVGELHVFMIGAVRTEQFPPLDTVTGVRTAFGLSAMLANPTSRGFVRIESGDPQENPTVVLNLATSEEDIGSLIAGIRLAWRILSDAALAGITEKIVFVDAGMLASQELLRRMVATMVRPAWHPVGTLRMGTHDDPLAIVTQYGELRGFENVTVADASIMPCITRGPTNSMCVVIGERIARHLRDRAGYRNHLS